MASVNATEISSLTISNEVSWQSALWGLVALALGSMTQRSGGDIYASAESLSPARSSPFVCMADMVVVILWIVKGRKLGIDVRSILRWQREELGLTRKSADQEGKQEVPVIPICLYVLGALPQGVKILGMSNVPWTKTWATILLVAWVFELIVGSYAGIPSAAPESAFDERKAATRTLLVRISRVIYRLAFAVHVVTWVWIMCSFCWDEIVIKVFGVVLGALLMQQVFFIGWGGPIVLVTTLLEKIFDKNSMPYLYLCSTGIVVYSIGWGYVYLETFWTQKIFNWFAAVCRPPGFVFAVWSFTVLTAIFVMLCARLLYGIEALMKKGTSCKNTTVECQQPEALPLIHRTQTFEGPDLEGGTSACTENSGQVASITDTASASARRPRRWKWLKRGFDCVADKEIVLESLTESEQDIRKIFALAFALANLTFAVLYYRFKYSSEGTVKPSWTDMLG